MKAELSKLVGEHVTIRNDNYSDEVEKFNFSLNGQLEETDDYGLYHVRVKECGYGTSGMSFHPRDVLRCEIMPSGQPEITLK